MPKEEWCQTPLAKNASNYLVKMILLQMQLQENDTEILG